MRLRLSWVDPWSGEADKSRPPWRIVDREQSVHLRAELAQLGAGELRHSLHVRRRLGGIAQRLRCEPVLTWDTPERLQLDFRLGADELGIGAWAFTARRLTLRAGLVRPDGLRLAQASAHAYAMPRWQFVATRCVRVLAYAPFFLIVWARSVGELGNDITAWYGALSLLVGFAVQEQPLARISSVFRAATRGVLPALVLLCSLLFLERQLLVRIENQTRSKLNVPGLQLDQGQAGLIWSWRASTPRTLGIDDSASTSLSLRPGLDAREDARWPGAFWATKTVACKPYWLDCQRDPAPADCASCVSGGDADQEACTRALGHAVELEPGCVLPRQVVVTRPISIVLGSHATPCDGSYELALSERSAFAGNAKARLQYARSFALLKLPAELQGLTLRWKNLAADSGFVSLLAHAPAAGEPACRAMIPNRSGTFEVELSDTERLGTLRCPSHGSCAGEYSIEPAYTLQPGSFDGLAEYTLERGRSVWTPLGGAERGFVCRCAQEAERRPKRAALRLTRPPPRSLRLDFSPERAPLSLDLAARDQRSTLACELPDDAARVEIQPVQLSFTRSGARVQVGAAGMPWRSDWQWLEGEHLPWSCIPVPASGQAAPNLEIRVDDGRAYPYRRGESGDTPELPTCYLHPRSGAVATQKDAVELDSVRGCDWQPATQEYASLVRASHVCGRVLSCR